METVNHCNSSNMKGCLVDLQREVDREKKKLEGTTTSFIELPQEANLIVVLSY